MTTIRLLRFNRQGKTPDFIRSSKIVAFFIILYAILYIFFYPKTFLITDEVCYFEQGYNYALCNQKVKYFFDLSFTYPVGMPLSIAFLLTLFGIRAVFLIGFSSLLASILIICKTLKNLNLPIFPVLLIFVYFPAVLLSRSVMSDVPSLFIVSLFFYLFLCRPESSISVFGASLVAGISILFRESNILILIPFLVHRLYNSKTHILYIMTGLILGIGMRLLSGYYFFDDPFFARPNSGFVSQIFLFNFPYYCLVLLTFVPFGLWFVVKLIGELRLAYIVSVFVFLGFYSTYNYNGFSSSGFRALILSPRFFIPILPIFCIACAQYFKTNKKFEFAFNRLLIVFSFFSIITIQLIGGIFTNRQYKFVSRLQELNSAVFIVTDDLQTSKYINHLYGDLNLLRENELSLKILSEYDVYAIDISKNNNHLKDTEQYKKIETKIKNLGNYSLKLDTEIINIDNSSMRLLKIQCI